MTLGFNPFLMLPTVPLLHSLQAHASSGETAQTNAFVLSSSERDQQGQGQLEPIDLSKSGACDEKGDSDRDKNYNVIDLVRD